MFYIKATIDGESFYVGPYRDEAGRQVAMEKFRHAAESGYLGPAERCQIAEASGNDMVLIIDEFEFVKRVSRD